MKTVFSNAMCAHVWAQQEQAYGRSSGGSMRFDGDTLWSYQTPIARILETLQGTRAMLLSAETYSPTTSQHRAAAMRAFGYGNEIFAVPSLGIRAGRNYADTPTIDHARNLAYLVEGYEKTKARLRRARDVWGNLTEALSSVGNKARAYAVCFGLEWDYNAEADAAAIKAYREERETRLNTPENRAKRERERERREERKRAAEAERMRRAAETNAERIAKWRAGEPGYYHLRNAVGSAMLRANGDNLETSLGATVPLAHARLAFLRVRHCVRQGIEWERNGGTIRVGHFQVDRIQANGNVHAGCHFIEWAEVEAFARSQGWEV